MTVMAINDRKDHETELEKQMAEALEDHPELGNYGINVYFHRGKATLTGIVDLLHDKQIAEAIVRKFPEVEFVENDLTLGNEKLYTDDKVKKDVEEELMRSRKIDLRKIGVEVDDGNVFLVGSCDDTEEERMAAEIVSRVQGVRDVYSRLEHHTH